MNASSFQLPQHVSEDRRRAREATIELQRRRLVFKADDLGGEAETGNFRRLPSSFDTLPKELDFPLSHLSLVGGQRVWTWLVEVKARLLARLFPLRAEKGYRALYRLMKGDPSRVASWRDDLEFGRQRLSGVNPMAIRRVRELEQTELFRVADGVLPRLPDGKPPKSLAELHAAGRLFEVDYRHMADPRIQKHVVQQGITLAAPRCLFWVDGYEALRPLAMQLRPEGVPAANLVFSPLSPPAAWLLARAHFQAADTHVHEAPYHLVETHLVTGAIALAALRQLHPDHPFRQLIEPHFDFNLAINKLALGGLLAPGGTIDTTVAAGVAGAMNAGRMHMATWRYPERTLHRDLAERGVCDESVLSGYYYRDDALRLHEAISEYTRRILRLWYKSHDDVRNDYELQRFVAEVGSPEGGNIPGFPAALSTCDDAFALAAEIIFRAGPQHAAVNNGQFDAYGWIPGGPGEVAAPVPETEEQAAALTEAQLWKAFPDIDTSLAQMGMVWVLSRPTVHSILHSGDAPAFRPELCFEADDVIGAFRRKLVAISDSIQLRNSRLEQPYVYLDPLNVSRSTDI